MAACNSGSKQHSLIGRADDDRRSPTRVKASARRADSRDPPPCCHNAHPEDGGPDALEGHPDLMGLAGLGLDAIKAQPSRTETESNQLMAGYPQVRLQHPAAAAPFSMSPFTQPRFFFGLRSRGPDTACSLPRRESHAEGAICFWGAGQQHQSRGHLVQTMDRIEVKTGIL